MIGAFSKVDPYLINSLINNTSSSTSARPNVPIARDPRLNAGERTGVFVIAGQSNASNQVNGVYVPVNSGKVDNLSLEDGGTYAAVDPLIGCTTSTFLLPNAGNLFTRFADKLITNHVYDRVILIPVAVGGTIISGWQAGGGLDTRITVAAKRAAAVGLTVTAFLWMQGESDGQAGTTQAAYTASLASVIGMTASAGFSAPWFIGVCTYIVGTVYPVIQAAQTAAVNGTTVFAGANTDTLTGLTNRQSDNTHLNVTGADAAAALWAAAIDNVF